MFYFLIGLIVGSFLNVCIYRLPREGSLVFPPSHCPNCQHRLGIWELIPVVSYLFLRGRCAHCRSPISVRYPLVELITGLLFLAIAVSFPLSTYPLEFCFYLIFVCLLIVAFFIDLEHQVIPDIVSLPGILLGLVYHGWQGLVYRQAVFSALGSAVIGLLLGYAILFIIGLLGKLWYKKTVMGEGDLYLAGFIGAFLGWQGVVLAIFLAYLLAAVVALAFLALGRVKLGEYIPFGPALVAGGLTALFFGNIIINWYLTMFI